MTEMRVIAIDGAAGSGKSTLAQALASGSKRRYFSLDDLDVVNAARRDPELLVGERPRVVVEADELGGLDQGPAVE